MTCVRCWCWREILLIGDEGLVCEMKGTLGKAIALISRAGTWECAYPAKGKKSEEPLGVGNGTASEEGRRLYAEIQTGIWSHTIPKAAKTNWVVIGGDGHGHGQVGRGGRVGALRSGIRSFFISKTIQTSNYLGQFLTFYTFQQQLSDLFTSPLFLLLRQPIDVGDQGCRVGSGSDGRSSSRLGGGNRRIFYSCFVPV